MIIKIPFKTPTINHLYGQHGKYKYLKAEAKELRAEIKDIVNNTICNPPEHLADKPLKVTTYIYEDWYCKNGSIKRVDIGNREKFLIDSVFDALEIDDKFIFKHTMIKQAKYDTYIEKDMAIIEITPL